jgi:hypothetical protein
MDDNQYSDGKIRGFGDALMRALVVGGALVVAVNAPYQWYWRILIFFAVLFLVGLIYPNVQQAIAKRKGGKISN